MGNNIGDYGMKMGKVVFDEENNRARITQKVAGVDIQEYVDGVKEAKLIVAKPLQDKIETMDKTLTSLESFKTKLQTLQSLATQMSNPLSTQAFKPSNVYNQHQINANTSDANFQITGKTTAGSFSMAVNQLASSDLRKFVVNVPNAVETPLGLTGSFTIGTSQPGTTKTITLTNSMSLGDIREALSSVSETTGINVELIRTALGSPNNTYELKFKPQNSGQSILLKNTDGTPLTGLGLNSLPSHYQAGILSAANEATALDLEGELTVQSSGGSPAAPVQITKAMSLTDIIGAINAQTSTTGVQASYDRVYHDDSEENPNPPQFQLKFTAVDPTTRAVDPAQTLTLSDTQSLLNSLGHTCPVTDYGSLIAKFVCDGTSLTSQSNTIDGSRVGTGIIPGVTVNLTKASGASFTGDITPSKIPFAETFGNFIDAYNDLNLFYNEQTRMNLDPDQAGKPAEGAHLFGNKMVEAAMKELKYNLTGAISFQNLPIKLTSLSQIGYRLQSDGTVEAKENSDDALIFFKSVENNFKDIQKLFSNTVTNSNSKFSIQNLPTLLKDDIQGKNMDVILSTDSNGVTTGSISITIDGTPTVCHGSISKYAERTLLTINDGGVLDGMVVRYNGTIPSASSVTTTSNLIHGIMSKVEVSLGRILDKSTLKTGEGEYAQEIPKGFYYLELERLNKTKTESKEKVERIKKDAEKVGKSLEKEFVRVYEATIQLENIMNMLESLNKAQK